MDVIGARKKGSWRTIALWLIATGVFVQLAGLAFNYDSSRYATQLYFSLFLPSLIMLLSKPATMRLWWQPSAIILLVLFSWVLLQAGLNPGSQSGLGQWAKVVFLLFLYISALSMLVEKEALLRRAILAAVTVVAFFAWATLYYQYGVLDHPLSYPEVRLFRLYELGWREFADLDHPIVAGLYYSVFAITLCWLFVSRPVSYWQAVLMGVGMLGLLLYVLFTFSRGAWFSLAAGLFVLLVFTPNLKARSLLALGAISLVLILFLLWPEIQAERSVGLSNRDQIWANWYAHLPDFWLWGSGIGAELFYRFSEAYKVIHAHSLYLQLWFELGIVGISLFAAFLVSLLWKAWQCRQQPLARLGGALLVFAIVAMVTDIYAVFHRPSPYWVVLWFPVGILLGVQKPERVPTSG
ncbi:O-antigen ligase family protein [Pseudomonas sp. PDM15]|uniref:O-antigen ligase family protein n=1 Tax=Pseudomonas sp. PDM15 TaxID=2769303 RepID=UPI0017841274|nr:O-antigen ligase family protein [Pseudomonas sp. PDM15]MBD9424672.1 O-antigen ligase family protein [Pseudomonas sp. PDM15]